MATMYLELGVLIILLCLVVYFSIDILVDGTKAERIEWLVWLAFSIAVGVMVYESL